MPWEGGYSGQEEWEGILPMEEELFLEFDYLLGSCITEHQIYVDCYNSAVSRRKKSVWYQYFSKTPPSFIGDDCRAEAREFELCNLDRDLRKIRVGKECKEPMKAYELCAYEKSKEFGKEFLVTMCEQDFRKILSCTKNVVDECAQDLH